MIDCGKPGRKLPGRAVTRVANLHCIGRQPTVAGTFDFYTTLDAAVIVLQHTQDAVGEIDGHWPGDVLHHLMGF